MAITGVATEEVSGVACPRDPRSERDEPPEGSIDAAELHPAFTVQRHVDRLVEVQIFQLRGIVTLDEVSRRIVAAARATPTPAVIFGDYRRARPFSQTVGDAWARAMRGFNEHLAWSALLLARSNETFNLQVERVVRCAGNPGRRLFCDAWELRAWVAQRATSAELLRIDQLVNEPR